VPFVRPRALQIEEMPYIVQQYARGARNALAAKFDGVEVHGANGYLIYQFISSGTNHRTDDYGGRVHDRARLLMEVVEAVSGIWGPDRVGVRLSPLGNLNDISDAKPEATFGRLRERSASTASPIYTSSIRPPPRSRKARRRIPAHSGCLRS
jgi:N-ethylmaleimide reductase